MPSLTVFYSMTMERFDSRVYCVGAFGRFVDELSRQYDTVYLCAPVRDLAAPKDEYCLASGNIILQPMPPYNSIISSLKHAPAARRALKSHSRTWETLYIRYPSPFSLYAFRLAKRRKLPVFVHLVGDTRKVVQEGSKFGAPARAAAAIYLAFAESAVKWMIRHAEHTLANGRDMRRLYRGREERVTEIRTSTFREAEIFARDSACSDSSSLCLINVGFLRHEKGLEYLFKAVPLVERALGKPVTLDLVGNGDLEYELKEAAKSLGLADRIHFHGYIPMGDGLAEMYRKADIFVLPSVSEGTPRVLLEAMANGLPVVATRVGGIPFTVEDGENGLLVDAKSEEQIARAILLVASDAQLRKRLVSAGYRTARENTLERHVRQVGEIIRAHRGRGGES